ncbi:docking protein 1-like [Saccostrea echinata]|uniref:docking protein 1-like n=1 Tax=Saccostrea echinata TaxID=191078 RepID=UPI002A8380B0|nr:docking protein 1-like [Saccostrea echinata]XP_061184309.1 docking protein 1-like [Saccostrea echinata]
MSRRTQLAEGDVQVKKGRLQSKKNKYLIICLGDEKDASYIEAYENRSHYENPSPKHKPKRYSLENLKEGDLDKVERNQAREFYIDIPFKKEKLCLMFENREVLAQWHDAIIQAINMDSYEEDELKENFLYESEDSAQVFDVVVQETEGSKRLNLNNCGKYKLFVTMASLGLEDTKTREIMGRWHFEYIRRYGFTKSRNLFTIEAGRRCETGEGSFDFHVVGNPKALTLAIDNATKSKQATTLTSRLGMESGNKDVAEKSRESVKSAKRASEPLSRKSSNSLKIEITKDSQSDDGTQTPSTLPADFKHSLEEKISNHPSSPKPHKEGSGKEKKRGFSFPWKRDKSEKKDNPKLECSEPNDLYDEPVLPVSSKASVKHKKSEPIYDEAGENKNPAPSVKPPVYAEPVKGKTEAWRNQGALNEHHEEDYKKIKDAASKDGGKLPHIADRPYDEDDEMYDRVELKANPKGPKPKNAVIPNDHIYGINSGKDIEDIDDGDYASAEFPENETTKVKSSEPEQNDYEFENEDDDDTYADTMNPTEEYADAVSCVRSEPPQSRPVLYEDVNNS